MFKTELEDYVDMVAASELPNGYWGSIIDVWRSGQIGLEKAIRWSKYNRPEDGGIRLQNSLQHSYSIVGLAQMFLILVRDDISLDGELLLSACWVHDHGEGEIGKDTLYIDKTADGDLDEYSAFAKRFSSLGTDMFQNMQKRFLLQFALKNPENFPEGARGVMRFLAENNRNECLAFDAIERWDYVLYAKEQYDYLNNEKILVQTLRGQIPHLDDLADNTFPVFGKHVWTPTIREWFNRFVEEREGKWIEQKGEK